jgi:ketosteroid isomerase-like protein
MAEHPDLNVFKQVHAAFMRGDMNALGDLVAEDIVWHTPGRNPLSGTYEGREATFESFAREAELCDNTYRVDVHDVLANERHTVALLRATAQHSNRELSQDYVLVFHIRDGRVTEAWEVWTDQATVDQFWSQ